MGAPIKKDEERHLAEVGKRATLTDEEREDAKEVLGVAIAGVQRERGAAEQYYLRGRNVFALTATLFTAAQAAFIASLGHESAGQPLLDEAERSAILWPAGVGAVFLIVALGLLVFWLDRSREMVVVGAETLTKAWLDPYGQHREEAVIDVLASRVIQEEAEWAKSNEDRKLALRFVGAACGLAGIAALVQLVVLYIGLT